MLMILPLRNLNEFTLREASIVLPWAVDVVFGVSKEFNPMCNPTSNTRNREEHWEHIGWETHCAVNQTAVKVNVRV